MTAGNASTLSDGAAAVVNYVCMYIILMYMRMCICRCGVYLSVCAC